MLWVAKVKQLVEQFVNEHKVGHNGFLGERAQMVAEHVHNTIQHLRLQNINNFFFCSETQEPQLA